MKKITLISLILTTFVIELNSGTIRGKVILGNERMTVAGVMVQLMDKNLRFSTDANGEFTIPNLTNGTYAIEFSQLGYKKKIVDDVSVKENETTYVEVVLEESPFQLHEVVVTGTLQKHLFKETPVITEIISSQDLKRSGTSEVSEILRTQTGIEVGTSISQTQSVRLQGLKKNQVLVLVDGERIAGKVDDAIDINQIPVQSIERIEIVKGPMSSIYGSDAIGGVINIITKEPAEGVTSADAALTVGSNGRQDYTMSASHSFIGLLGEQSSLNVLLSSGWNKYFGVDYNADDYVSEMPEFDRKNASLKISGKTTDRFRFDLKADYYKDNLEWLAGGNQYLHFIDYADNKKITTTGMVLYTFGAATMVKASGSYSTNDHGSSEKTGAGYLVRSSITNEQIKTLRLQVTTLPYKTSTLTVGVETNDEQVTSARILNGEKNIINNVLYAEDEWAIGDFTFNIGTRYSDHSQFGTFFAPRVSTLYKATERLTLRASYGRGFRSPTINELYLDFNHVSIGYVVKGNQALQPETSHGINLGFDYSREDLIWFRLNAYYNDVTNMINYYYVSPNPVVFSYRNIASATAKGIDLDVDIRPATLVTITLGYNFNETKDHAGNLLPFHSPHTVNVKANIELPVINGNFFARFRWYDKQPVVDEQTNTNAYDEGAVKPSYYYSPAYHVVDINTTSKIFSTFEISAGINNVLNKKVFPFGQIKGREFFGGLRYTF